MTIEKKVPKKKVFPKEIVVETEVVSVEPKQEDGCCHKHHCCSGGQAKVSKPTYLYLLLIAASIILPVIGFMFGIMATYESGYCYY